MSFLTQAGEAQIANKQGNASRMTISHFVLANVPDLGSEPSDRVAELPSDEQIVQTLPYTKHSYVNPNQVVYSLIMDSTIGDFTFNWIGLVDEEEVLIAVAHITPIEKRKSTEGVEGNTIARNFLLKYSGIQNVTGANVPAETWQLDFSARFNGMDERERLSNLDLYGQASFLDSAYQVIKEGDQYQLQAGVGYVGGIRSKLAEQETLTVSDLPCSIWLDVSLQGDVSDKATVSQIQVQTEATSDFVDSDYVDSDYVDSNGIAHYVSKLADIDANGEITDTRSLAFAQSMINTLAAQLSTSFNKRIRHQAQFQLDAGQLKNAADVDVALSGHFYRYPEGLEILLPDSLSLGTDYAIYATPDGLLVSANFTMPEGYTAETSRRVGGFHYQDGFINEYSLYDLNYRPNVRDPRGMVRSPQGIWSDIYLLNTTPDLLGTSAYGAQIADGDSAPKVPVVWGGDGTAQYDDFSRYTAARVLAAFGKRLPFGHEFEQLAFGSTTGYKRGTDPVTTEFNAAARSMIGCEGVSGVIWQWGAEMWDRGNGSSGYEWYAGDTNGEGQIYSGAGSSGVGASLFGGGWDFQESGPRCSAWSNTPWHSVSHIAARGVCDHVECY
ncbi:phage tail protein [Marinomonas sp. THO17]|uniref:phage tail-collar fiber domain-containing protein n=1 Tax=Marinomonas sp. THO17 TaxID=3149048 RepID=UPI00336BCEF4